MYNNKKIIITAGEEDEDNERKNFYKYRFILFKLGISNNKQYLKIQIFLIYFYLYIFFLNIRIRLPAKMIDRSQISIWSILKQSIGKVNL